MFSVLLSRKNISLTSVATLCLVGFSLVSSNVLGDSRRFFWEGAEDYCRSVGGPCEIRGNSPVVVVEELCFERWGTDPPDTCLQYDTANWFLDGRRLEITDFNGDGVGAKVSFCPIDEKFDPLTDQCIPYEEDIPGEECTADALHGNPINIFTRNKIHKELDYEGLGASPLEFHRYYNSSTRKWTFSHANRLTVSQGEVLASQSDGSTHRYSQYTAENGEVVDEWVSDPGQKSLIAPILDETDVHIGWRLSYTETNVVQEYSLTGSRQKSILADNSTLTYTHLASKTSVTDSFGNSIHLHFDTNGNLASLERPDQSQVVYSYDLTGRLVTANKHGAARTYHYEDPHDAGLLTGITDETGSRYVTWTYDVDGHPVGSENAGFDATTIDYSAIKDPLDPRITVTNALGKSTTYHFAEFEGRRRVSFVEGVPSANCVGANRSYSYVGDLIRQKTDWKGNVTEYDYWNDELEKYRIEAQGTARKRTFYFEWDHQRRLKTLERLEGVYEITYQYDDDHRLVQQVTTDLTNYSSPYVTNGQARSTNYSHTYWDADHTQLKSISVDGPRTDVSDVRVIQYTNQGYLLKVTNALGHEYSVVEHFPDGRVKTALDENGVELRYTYSPQGMIDTFTIENGTNDVTTDFDYDALGQLVRTTQPNGVQLQYFWNAARNLTSISDAAGAYIAFTRDAAGNITATEIIDENSVVRRAFNQIFDELSRLITTVGATDLQEQQFSYDVNDNPLASQKDSEGSYQRVYDELDRVIEVIHADVASSRYFYDAQGRITQIRDQNGLSTYYQYDGLGNLMRVESPDTGMTLYFYDAAGNRVQQTNASGVVTEYSYDALQRQIAATYPTAPDQDIIYSYDSTVLGNHGVGKLTGMTDPSGSTDYSYNNLGQLISRQTTIGSELYAWSFEYDAAGLVTKLVYPSGRVVRYTRNGLGQVDGVRTSESLASPEELVADQFEYLPFGPVASYHYGNGVVATIGHDLDYRTSSISAVGLETLIDLDYDYTLASNISDIGDFSELSNSQSFTYDPESRLDSAVGNYGVLNYDYDHAGNRTLLSVDDDGLPGIDGTVTYDYAHPISNHLTSLEDIEGVHDFTYSSTGSLLTDPRISSVFSYDEADRLASVNSGTVTTYKYNGLGQRATKTNTSSSETIHFHYSETGQLLAEYDGLTGALIREYIYVNELLTGLIAPPLPSNSPPTADAGPDNTYVANELVSLDGSNSTDADGYIESYIWTQTAGTVVSVNNADQSLASFTAPTVSDYEILSFELQVTDDLGASASDTVSINIQEGYPPQTSLTSLRTKYGGRIYFDVNLSVDESGTTYFRLTGRGAVIAGGNNSTEWQVYSGPLQIQLEKGKKRTLFAILEFYSVDEVGNIETTKGEVLE